MKTGCLYTVGYGSTGDLQGPELRLVSMVWGEVVSMTMSAVPLACTCRQLQVSLLPEKDSPRIFEKDFSKTCGTLLEAHLFASILFSSFLVQQILCKPKWSEWLPDNGNMLHFYYLLQRYIMQQRPSHICITCLLTLHHQWEWRLLTTLMSALAQFFSPGVLWKSGRSVYLVEY